MNNISTCFYNPNQITTNVCRIDDLFSALDVHQHRQRPQGQTYLQNDPIKNRSETIACLCRIGLCHLFPVHFGCSRRHAQYSIRDALSGLQELQGNS